jgi:hypothetical protein
MIQGLRRTSRGAVSAPLFGAPSGRWGPVVCVVQGELYFLFFTAVSVALHPGFVLKRDEGGMSDYGLHVKTAVTYTLALGLLALYSRRAALFYTGSDERSRRLRLLLQTYCFVVSSVLLSTYFYSLNLALKDLHFACGTALVVVVGVASLWMYGLWPPSPGVRLLLLIQLTGDALALLTSVGAVHVLFLSEIVSNVGFACLLVRTTRRIAVEGEQRSSALGMSS